MVDDFLEAFKDVYKEIIGLIKKTNQQNYDISELRIRITKLEKQLNDKQK